MQPSFTCLGPDELKKFIAGDMAPKRVDEIEDHLSTCETCRGSLEATVGDRAWWQDLDSALRSDTGEGEYENTESRESVCQRLTALLGPTDDPSMLGRIGAYEIIGLLGYGGMGAVFKARDPGLNRYVAIKILLPHLALSGAARARFRREGQAAAAIIDDCVLPIYAVDEWQGIPYLVMQYTQGVSLQKRIHDRGPLELKEILRIGLQAARGLAAAHAQGLVHRDVKPSNILLAGSVDRALLTDFGLARAVDDASLTTSGMIAGTPQYMSPEQARAESVDHRSDLFSLGSVMYAMCTGHAPFRAESSYSVLRLITDKEPRPIREINPEVPDWLDQFIKKLMAKQPEDRVASAQEAAELLEAFLAHVQKPTSNPLPIRFAQRPKIFSPSFLQRSFQGWMKMPRIISVGLLVVSFILIQLLTNISGVLQERDETRSLGLRVVSTLLPIAYLGAILAIAACVGAFRKSATDFRKARTLATQHWKGIIAISSLIASSLGIYAFSLPSGEPFALPLKGSATDGKLKIGEPFPIIKGKDLDGREFVLGPGEYGDRATLIIFWSTWCGFCMDDMPHEIELTKKYASDGLRVIGVNGDSSEEVASKAVIKHGNPWRNLYEGSEQTISKQLGIKGWPALYLLDEQGKIVSETRYLRTGTFQSLGFGKKQEVYGLDWTLERLLQRDPRESARAQEMAINDPQTKSDCTLERATGPQAEDNPISQTTMPATEVITVNQKSLSGIWKAKQIISAGQVVPPEKAPDEFVFRRNQMIWKFTGKIKRDDVIFDVELDFTKSPAWITLRSQDSKRPQPVLGLIDFTGHELRIFTKRDAKGNPSTERPTAIGTGNEPGTDLMILELKSASVDEWRTYPIEDYVLNVVSQWKESSNVAEPSEEAIKAKVAEVGNKLVEDIDGRFGPCNVIEFDATSKTLIIDHTEQAHRKIEAFLKESIPVSATQSVSGPVDDSVIVARPEFDQPQGIEAAKRFEQQAQEIANLPRFYLYANYVSDWLDGMSDEADRSEANFERQ